LCTYMNYASQYKVCTTVGRFLFRKKNLFQKNKQRDESEEILRDGKPRKYS
jgi:hypothetical protein